jgi:flagellin
MNMLTGRFAMSVNQNVPTASMWFHIGANVDQRMQVFIGTMTASGLGIRNPADNTFISLETPDSANQSIATVDAALTMVNKQRADLGAYQNRLEHAVRSIDNGAENLQASESRIRDTNMASQMVNYVRNQILTQAGTAMLSQANQRASDVLQVMR